MKRILIVEDDVEMCLSLSDLLSEFGFETAVAQNGVKALEILKDAAPLPDIILMDLWMPEMNGWQLMDKLKADSRYKNIPVLTMSADTKCEVPNLDEHFAKPFDANLFMSSLIKKLSN